MFEEIEKRSQTDSYKHAKKRQAITLKGCSNRGNIGEY
jgi:hypothetical protein